jgi:hypothetical protein
MNAALQIITPNQMRGQITALFLFVFNIIGFGIRADRCCAVHRLRFLCRELNQNK